MDVKSAFIYGTIKEEVYVCQPPGFKDPEYPDKVYKVVKALYGLHQAPRAWYETLATYLLENGFQRGTIDQTLFIKKQQKDIILVQIYVDDIIFGATNKALCQSFEKLMKDKFQMSSMGELTFFLGLVSEGFESPNLQGRVNSMGSSILIDTSPWTNDDLFFLVLSFPRVIQIVLLGLKSVPRTSYFVGMRGCIFNKGLFVIFHAILSVVETTTDLTRASDFVHLRFFSVSVTKLTTADWTMVRLVTGLTWSIRFGLGAKGRCHDEGPFVDIIAKFCGPFRWKELSKETSSKILPGGDGSCWKTFKLRYHVVPYWELNGIPVAFVASFGVVSKMDVVFDGAFRGVGDEEVIVGEGLDEEAFVEFMIEWCEKDEDDDRNEKDDLFN
nr:putative ribonuclease H-like domain-containing protein [Tanacetum cinerariifolium]